MESSVENTFAIWLWRVKPESQPRSLIDLHLPGTANPLQLKIPSKISYILITGFDIIAVAHVLTSGRDPPVLDDSAEYSRY